MSTEATLRITSTGSDATERLGEKLGKKLKGGEVIELVSDLGGGKTTFVHGLARGIGSRDRVNSPTFKICNVYSGKKLSLYHYDFYRLADAGLMAHELHDALEDPNAVVVVEWGDVVQHVLPNEQLTIKLTAIAEDSREITITYPDSLKYLVEDL